MIEILTVIARDDAGIPHKHPVGLRQHFQIAGISPALLRAFLLRIQSLEMSGETSPRATVSRELGDALNMQSALYHFDMEQEPVLSVTGMNRPVITGVDMALLRSPARRMKLAAELAAKDHEQAEG